MMSRRPLPRQWRHLRELVEMQVSDYEVGYGKPPSSGQIRKGEVRNPYGRAGKKGVSKPVTTEAAILEQIDGETVVVDGRAMTRREAHVRAQYMSALKGKANAIRFIDRLSQRANSQSQTGGVLTLPCDNPDGWNAEDAIAQYHARLERERRNARRNTRRAKAKVDSNQSLPLQQDWEILSDLESETVEQDGRVMTMRELRLRIYKALAVKGSRAAQAALVRIQDASKSTEGRRPGVLLVPPPMAVEEWEVMTARQQAPYREQTFDDAFSEPQEGEA
jgi:hypothetical protein